MIMFKKDLIYMIHNIHSDTDGRLLIVEITIDNLFIQLINIYASNEDNPVFFENMLKFHLKDNAQIIIAGEFNTFPDTEKDWAGTHILYNHPLAANEMEDVKASLDLVDIWRFQHSDSLRYTWRRGQRASRIDYFLISFSLVPKALTCHIGDKFRSAHSMVVLKIITAEYPRGKGYWKINQSLLKDINFVNSRKQFIK